MLRTRNVKFGSVIIRLEEVLCPIIRSSAVRVRPLVTHRSPVLLVTRRVSTA